MAGPFFYSTTPFDLRSLLLLWKQPGFIFFFEDNLGSKQVDAAPLCQS